jgi:hypothetical protein
MEKTPTWHKLEQNRPDVEPSYAYAQNEAPIPGRHATVSYFGGFSEFIG